MAWLFGGSLKKPKPEVYVTREVEDGFNLISKNPPPPIPTQYPGGMSSAPNAGYPLSPGPGYPLYPNLPQSLPPAPYLAICPAAPPGYQPPPLHPLDSVPFKLDPSLEPETSSVHRRTLSELERIRSTLTQINHRINSPDYTYSFELEKSVLKEECFTTN